VRLGSPGVVSAAALLATGAACAALACGSSGEQAVARCHTADLSGRLGFIQGAAGSRFGPVVLTNRSEHACTLHGYIGGQLYSATGRPLRTRVVRDRSRPARTVTVPPGRTAVAELHWVAIPAGSAGSCPQPRSFAVTPPDERTQLRVRWTAGWVCGQGRIDVRAIRR
jgi:hypothetical protein